MVKSHSKSGTLYDKNREVIKKENQGCIRSSAYISDKKKKNLFDLYVRNQNFMYLII